MKHTNLIIVAIIALAVAGGLLWYSGVVSKSFDIVAHSALPHLHKAATSATPASSVGSTPPAPTPSPYAGPVITSMTPAKGVAGTLVTIRGLGFDPKETNSILFGATGGRHHMDGSPDNQIDAKASPDGRTLSFHVPSSGPSGRLCTADNQCIAVAAMLLTDGPYRVVVHNANGTSNAVSFELSR